MFTLEFKNATREVYDFAIPKKTFATTPSLTVMLYILSPHTMIGLNYSPYVEDKPFLLKNVASLPVLGGFMNGRQINLEKLLTYKPEVIFGATDAQIVMKKFDDTLRAFDIRVVYLDTQNLNALIASMKTMGKVLGEEERANKLAKWAKNTLSQIDSLNRNLTKNQRVKIYFAQGNDGLSTECGSDSEDDIATAIGGQNIFLCAPWESHRRLQTNFEQLYLKNPQAIFVREIALFNELLTRPPTVWQQIDAIKNKQVFYAPSSPSNWLNRPPSLMRIIGIPWAFSKLHQEIFSSAEMHAKIKEFYKLFLHYELSQADILKLQKGD